MRTLTPSAQKICAIAVEQFAERGYDVASLNDIAAAAGMRKPSLYAHFSSKEDLFEAAFERAVEAERLYVEQCFAQCDDALPGAGYAHCLGERYQQSAHLRFLLRTAFFPPAALVQQGTTVNQRVFTGTLADLPQLVAEHEVHAPTLVIVGEVVQLREKLAWFEGAQ